MGRPGEPRYVLGIDESGTGAIAGPFTVAGIVVPLEHPDLVAMHTMGTVRDSKKLSEKARRRALDMFVDYVIFGKVSIIEVDRIRQMKHKVSLRWGVDNVIRQVIQDLAPKSGEMTIIVDGSVDIALRAKYGASIQFIPKADINIPVVSAASIYAKTVRTDLMIELGKQYPEFGFKENAGYGTPKHVEALRRFGRTKAHRPIKTMDNITTKSYTRRVKPFSKG